MTDTATATDSLELQKRALHHACVELAARCDGAKSADGTGFNASDSGPGKRLAALPPEIWEDQWVAGTARLLRKYHDQLASYGVDVTTIKSIVTHTAGGMAPPPQIDRLRAVTLHHGRIAIRFGYNKELVAAVKRLPSRRFEPESKLWTAPLAARPAVLAFANEHRFKIDPALLSDRIVAAAAAAAPLETGSFDFQNGVIIAKTPIGSGQNGVIQRDFNGRKFEPTTKSWLIRPHLVRKCRELVVEYGMSTTPAFDEIPDVDPDVMPVTLESHGGLLLVQFPYDEALVAAVRSIRGARWDQRAKAWQLPVESGFDLLSALENVDVDLSDYADELLDQARKMIANITDSRALEAELDVPGLALELRPFQKAGVRYAADARRCIIGDDMGLGKTPQGLATLQLLDAFPAVVLVPEVVKTNWQRETNKFLPHLRTVLLYGVPKPEVAARLADWLERGHSPYDDSVLIQHVLAPGETAKLRIKSTTDLHKAFILLRQADLVVVNYDIFGPTELTDKEKEHNEKPGIAGTPAEKVPNPGWTKVLKALPKNGLVADECHNLKNPKALRTRAAIEISRTLDEHGVVLGLSGSPVLNRRAEMASQIDFIGRLHEFGGAAAVKAMPDLARRLRARCMVRRLKADVLPELPPRNYVPVVVPEDQLDAAIMKKYRLAEKDLLEFIAQRAAEIALESGEDPHSAAVQAKVKARGMEFLIRIGVLLRLAMQAKLPYTRRWIDDFRQTQEKLLAFSMHLEPIDEFSARYNAPIIKGGVSSDKRMEIVDAFQNTKECDLVFLQIAAGGVGLTMTAASNALFIEQPWSPLLEDQALDRCYGRLNDVHGAVGWVVVAENTIEEWLCKLLDDKRVECSDALDGELTEEEIEASSVYDDFVELLTERALAKTG